MTTARVLVEYNRNCSSLNTTIKTSELVHPQNGRAEWQCESGGITGTDHQPDVGARGSSTCHGVPPQVWDFRLPCSQPERKSSGGHSCPNSNDVP
ncbi:hypothetical protein Ocin01_11685 [Orchesella cincta]|uniref:Uncharacterized protein n=1 Tax=Orchesella cincta TaxID=48709 RepID=A0A1D2MPL1_ORCCI|nr:hypothetical protein Ocin01_11685 [Orchesella cincta]